MLSDQVSPAPGTHCFLFATQRQSEADVSPYSLRLQSLIIWTLIDLLITRSRLYIIMLFLIKYSRRILSTKYSNRDLETLLFVME